MLGVTSAGRTCASSFSAVQAGFVARFATRTLSGNNEPHYHQAWAGPSRSCALLCYCYATPGDVSMLSLSLSLSHPCVLLGSCDATPGAEEGPCRVSPSQCVHRTTSPQSGGGKSSRFRSHCGRVSERRARSSGNADGHVAHRQR